MDFTKLKENRRPKSVASTHSEESNLSNLSNESSNYQDVERGVSGPRTRSVTSHNSQHSSLSSIGGQSGKRPGQKFVDRGRYQWPGQMDSILSMIAFAVGISNISQVPLTAYNNGGPVFFIPYIIFMCFCAYPILCMELILGQFIQQGAFSVWKIAPIFKGAGYSVQIILWFLSFYYNSVLSWSIMYIGESFVLPLPYTSCENEWNTANCIVPTIENYNAKEINTFSATAASEFFRGRILRLWPSKYADGDRQATALGMTPEEFNRNGNDTKFFGLNTKLGTPVLDLSICNFFVYFSFFLILIFGLKLSRRIVLIAVSVPYAIMAIIFFRGVTLQGSLKKGINELVVPNWSKLATRKIWVEGAIQTFYSTGAGFGVHLTLSSFNNFNQNIFRDAAIVCIVDVITSICSIFVVYCYIGNMAFIQGRNSTEVIKDFKEGIDIIFELFPDAFGNLSGARFFSLIFFTMLFLTSYDTGMIIMQAITLSFLDEFKSWFPKGSESKNIVSFALTSFSFVISLLSLTRGGIFVYKFMQNFAGGISLLITILVTVVAISWLWGMDELCNAAEIMTGRRPGIYLRVSWKYVCPVILVLLIILEDESLKEVTVEYNHEKEPDSVLNIGRVFTYVPVFAIPIYAIYALFHYPAKNFKQRILLLINPENEHKDIKQDKHTINRLSVDHCFYVGWRAAYKVCLGCCSAVRSVKIQPTATEMNIASVTESNSSLSTLEDNNKTKKEERKMSEKENSNKNSLKKEEHPLTANDWTPSVATTVVVKTSIDKEQTEDNRKDILKTFQKEILEPEKETVKRFSVMSQSTAINKKSARRKSVKKKGEDNAASKNKS